MALIQASTLLRTENSGATSTHAYTSNLAAGSLSIVYAGNYPNGFSSVSGSTNGAYTKAVTYGDGGINFAEIWYKANTSAGAETITLTPTSTSGNYVTAVFEEWSGMATSSPLDQTGSAGSLTVSTGGATAQADELVCTLSVADGGNSNMNWGTPSGYTLIARENDSNTYTGFQAARKVVSATGTQSATHTTSGTAGDSVIATFKIATGSTTESRALTSTGVLSASISVSARNSRAFTSTATATSGFSASARNSRSITASAAATSNFSASARNVRAMAATATAVASFSATARTARSMSAAASLAASLVPSVGQSRTLTTAATATAIFAAKAIVSRSMSAAGSLSVVLDSHYQQRTAMSSTATLTTSFDAVDGASGAVSVALTATATLTASFSASSVETGNRPSRPHRPRGEDFYRSITGVRVPVALKAKSALAVAFTASANTRAVSMQTRAMTGRATVAAGLASNKLYAHAGLIRTYPPRTYKLERS